jgi:hypothetical protein
VVAFGINDQEIGDIVAYVMGSDFIVSSEIHTVTFTGQNVGRFAQTTRLTIPDVISGIVKKNPDIGMEDFLPSPCAHPLCYAICYLLKTENTHSVPFARFMKDEDIAKILARSLYMQPDLATEEVMNDVLNDVWSRELSGEKEALIIRQMRSMLEEIYDKAKTGRAIHQSRLHSLSHGCGQFRCSTGKELLRGCAGREWMLHSHLYL